MISCEDVLNLLKHEREVTCRPYYPSDEPLCGIRLTE